MLGQAHRAARLDILHERPWRMDTERQYGPPEESALPGDGGSWDVRPDSTPLPYDRFKRDIYNLASDILYSGEWHLDWEVEMQLIRWKDASYSQVIFHPLAVPTKHKLISSSTAGI